MKFSEKIMKLRRQKGLSQEEFANKLNVSRQAIYKWETEQSVPDIKNVQEISKIFNVSIEYLLNDDLNEDVPQEKHSSKKSKKFIIKSIFKFLIILLIIYLIVAVIKFCLVNLIAYRYSRNANNLSNNSMVIRGEEIIYDNIKHVSKLSSSANEYSINGKTLFFYNSIESNTEASSIRYTDYDNKLQFYLESKDNNEYTYNDESNDAFLIEEPSEDSGISLKENFADYIKFSFNPFSFVTLNTVYSFSIIDHSYTLYNFNNGLLKNHEAKTINDRYTYYTNSVFEYANDGSYDDPVSEDEFFQFACTDGRNVDYNILKSYIEKQQKAE